MQTIERGECPACPDRYVHTPGVKSTFTNAAVSCSCCGSNWTIEPEGWAAVVESGGLQEMDLSDLVPLPDGVTIDNSSFEILIFDETQSVERILRFELRSTTEIGIGVDPRVEAVVDDLLEGVQAASRGRADELAEVYRSVDEGGLDQITAQMIESRAISLLREIHQLLDRGRPSRVPGGVVVSDELFRTFVQDAIDSLPEEFSNQLENVAVTVADRNRDESLYGLYRGVDLTQRQVVQFGHLDVITIYKDEICEDCETIDQVRAEVCETLLHEVGHHFGISDAQLRELGY